VSEFHFCVVYDTETGTLRAVDLAESPVDSDAPVWDASADEWRPLDDEEFDLYVEIEGEIADLIEPFWHEGDLSGDEQEDDEE
jgi:hypothetical protein